MDIKEIESSTDEAIKNRHSILEGFDIAGEITAEEEQELWNIELIRKDAVIRDPMETENYWADYDKDEEDPYIEEHKVP